MMNFISIMVYVMIVPVLSECCNSRMGKSNYVWQHFATPVKNQKTTSLCWLYSSLSYVEMMYNYNNNIKYDLSINQVTDNLHNYFNGTNNQCTDITVNSGGYPECALKYIEGNGIMSTFMYAVKQRYSKSNILPIVVSNISTLCTAKHIDKYSCLKKILYETPVIAIIFSKELKYISNMVPTPSDNRHAVLITDICENNGETYIEYQNSWGALWGECNGFGYMKVSSENGEIYNTRGILNHFTTAIISDDVHNVKYGGKINIENGIRIIYSTIGLVICIILTITAVIIFKKFK